MEAFAESTIKSTALNPTTINPIAEALDRLESHVGPHRVLVNLHGEAKSPRRLEAHGGWQSHCHCVLVRDDGWTLGCTRELYDAAKQLWPRNWVALICYANTPHRVVIKLAH